MPDTWRNTAFWMPKITLFAVILICSLGLCGVNYASASIFFNNGIVIPILMGTGLVEIVGMVVGALGLIVSVAGLAVASLSGHSSADESTLSLHLHDREDDR